MKTIKEKLTEESLETFFYEKHEAPEVDGVIFEAAINTFEYVPEENAHLYQLVLQDTTTNKFYATTLSVDEGDWTVWNLDPENLTPVVRVERVEYDYVEPETAE